MQVLVVFAFVALAMHCSCVDGLVCYECKSDINGECKSPTSGMSIECKFSCITMWTEYHVGRSCGPPRICSALSENSLFPNPMKRCNYCNEDLCNAAPRSDISLPLLCAIVGAILAHVYVRQ